MSKKVLVIGGAGYVGSVLVPKILQKGHEIRVLDLYIFGEDVLAPHRSNPRLVEIKGDMRDPVTLDRALEGVDTVVHLACISNDPSFDLDPALGKSINYDALAPIVEGSRRHGVKRFIFASSAAAYGLQDAKTLMREDSIPNPQTDYAKYKLLAEKYLQDRVGDMTTVMIRSATVAGFSPRMRLDTVVNAFVSQAYVNGEITVFTPENIRPFIHVEDIADLYADLIETKDDLIHREVFNAGAENLTILELAELIKKELAPREVKITHVVSPDQRSCKLDSTKISQRLGFSPKRTIAEAARDVFAALEDRRIVEPVTNPAYYSIQQVKRMKLV
ncbi:MAG: SDR family oxidoreductase [Parcubacteria group bacterium]|nr:SDR family oxidoreductase [Parcubacteria group bacterium]